MFRTTKKEMIFYDDFQKIIDLVYDAAICFEKMLNDFQNVSKYTEQITKFEHECDKLVHGVFERVNSSFITPLDREDIIAIAKALDEVLDQMEETVHRFSVYRITAMKDEASTLAKLIKNSVEDLQKLIRLLPEKSYKEMHKYIVTVNDYENQGDHLYRKELANLFANETDAIEIIKWNAIYDCLENTLDACEVVANMVEGIVMKNA